MTQTPTMEKKNDGETREQIEARLKGYYTGRQTLRFRVANPRFPRYLIADLGPFQVRPASINYHLPAGEAVECTVRLSRNKGRRQLLADPIDRKYVRALAIEMIVPVFQSQDGTWFAQEPETGKRVMFFDQDAGQTGNLWLITGRENDTWIAGTLVQPQAAAGGRQIQLEPVAEEDEPTFADPAELVRQMMGKPPQYTYLGKDGQTPAQILGIVSHFAQEQELRAAYKRQALRAHPDNDGSDEDFAVLNRAAAWITLLKALTGGGVIDIVTVLGLTDQMALVGVGETTAANGIDIAGGDVAPILSRDEQRIRDLVSFFRHEAEVQGQAKHGRKGAEQKPTTPTSELTRPPTVPTVESLDLEGWNREALRNAAVALGLTQGKTGERDRLLPLIQAHLAAEPTETARITGLKPTAKASAGRRTAPATSTT